MRRPAPIPASADEPDEQRPARGRGETPRPSVPRRKVEREPVPDDADTDVLDDVVAPLRAPATDDREESAGTGEPEGAGESDDAPEQAPLRSSDVWKAARARRKALRAEIRRFTQRSRRRRLVFWGSIGAVVALVVGSVVAAYSPLFAVEKITVAGTQSLDAATVQAALSDQLGSPLALVDASEVKSALTEFPMIETYALEARPPHELLVRIVERTPIGVIRSGGSFTLVDAAGVVLSTTPTQPEGQPVLDISGGTESEAFRSAGLVVRSLPQTLRTQVTQVKASSADDVTLRLQDGKNIIWGSEKDSAKKAATLVKLIAAAPDAGTYDVSSPTAAVVR